MSNNTRTAMDIQTLSKGGGVIFLYGVGFIFAAVIAYQVITGVVQPNALAVGIVNIIIGYVINSVGVQHGVSVTNDTVAKTAVAQFPLTPEGQAVEHASQAAEAQKPMAAGREHL